MSLDLEQRYARIDDGRSDHVCTGNVIWRLDAIRRVGGLDETLGYGYDNDLSYRLNGAGYHLVIRERRQRASMARRRASYLRNSTDSATVVSTWWQGIASWVAMRGRRCR